MKNMLVTGGCGFIGTNFIRYMLSKQGREAGFSGRIINVDKLTYAGNPENLSDIEAGFSDRYLLIRADIGDYDRMKKVFVKYDIDSICHFAAESHVDRSIQEPGSFIRTNIHGTYTILELARKTPARIDLFHHVSTDEVYGSLGREGYFTETTPYDPSSPYSASKAASDHLVRAYHRTYDLPVTLSNCSNNYGPYQFPEKLIPLMILNSLEGTKLPVYGKGGNIRDWLYVNDHCAAIWLIMKKGTRGETYNIGGNCEKRNIDVVRMICDLLDRKNPRPDESARQDLITFVKDRPGHDFRYALDISKINNELGWKPRESFETGLEKTIDWYLKHPEWIEKIKSGEYLNWIKKHYPSD